jgi:iron complex outermembrane receptor protein
MRTLKFEALATTALALLVAGSVGAASRASAAEAADGAPTALQEVIVTATRREANPQTVPVSLTVITAQDLKTLHVQSLEDLQYSIPNFSFGGESTARRPDITLRGIDSATRVPGFEGSIGFFVDGVYQPFPDQWNNPVLDVDRLEVLYGPQDTLFGKNTIAGAISITTKRPTETLDGEITAEGGNYSYYAFNGFTDVPLVKDTLFLRVSAEVTRRDGYITNVYNGEKYDNLSNQGGRIQLRYVPTPKFEANLGLGYYDEHQAEVQGQTIGDLYSTGDPRTVNLNTNPLTSRQLYDATLELKYKFDSGATLTSITAFAATRAWYRTDEDGNPVDEWVTNIVDHTHNFSQELRFASPTGGKFDYIGGLYYLSTYWAQPGSLQTLPGDPNNDPGGLGWLNPDGTLSYSDAHAKRVTGDSYAGYVNGAYHFNERWTLNLGGRLTYDEKYLTYPGQINFGAGFLNLCKLGRSFGAGCLIPGGDYPNEPSYQDTLGKGAPTGSASLDYQATKDILIYGKISNGYKGGGWNSDLTHSYPPAKFSAEHVVNYEFGFKSETFDHHLRLNADMFYEDYKNKQETVFVNITQGFIISNAASATIWGGEANATLSLGDFLFNGGFGYIEPTYNNFQCAATVNCAGQQLVFASKYTGDLSAEFHHSLGQIGKFTLQTQLTWKDRIYFTAPNALDSSVPGYALLNARASLKLRDDKTEIFVFGKNLADKTYLISNFPGSPSYPGYGATADVLYGAPRMIGAGVTRSF